MSQKLVVEFYVPKEDNDGNPVPETVLLEIMEEVTARFGGFTCYQAFGGWKDPTTGCNVSDKIGILRCITDRVDDSELQEMAESFRMKTNQKAFWVTCGTVFLVEANSPEVQDALVSAE